MQFSLQWFIALRISIPYSLFTFCPHCSHGNIYECCETNWKSELSRSLFTNITSCGIRFLATRISVSISSRGCYSYCNSIIALLLLCCSLPSSQDIRSTYWRYKDKRFEAQSAKYYENCRWLFRHPFQFSTVSSVGDSIQ